MVKMADVVKSVWRWRKASVPYVCHANSSATGAKQSTNHAESGADEKVGCPEI